MSDKNVTVRTSADGSAAVHAADLSMRSDSSLAFVTLSKDLEALKTRVDGLEAQRRKKFYQDQSFWIGITAIPIVFASGWLLKLATDSPLLLLEIHRLLGTEPALVAALDERHNALKDAIQSLDKGRAPILTALLRVGLLQEHAQKLDCSPDTSQPAPSAKLQCQVPQDAFLNVADAPFSVAAATKVDIGIVINVFENVFGDDGYRVKIIDKTTELKNTPLINVAVNGVNLELKPMKFSPVLNVDNLQYQFVRYSFPCFRFNDPEVPGFPINTLSVAVANPVNHHYSIIVGALLQESSQSCAEKE